MKSLSSSPPPKYKITTDPLPHHPMTDPLPSYYRPPSPPTILSSQPPSAQLAMYRHMQYLNYYQNKQFQHQAEINKLQAIREAARVTSASPPPCYVRNFPSPMSVTPPGSPQNKFIFPERGGFGAHGMEELDTNKELGEEGSFFKDKQGISVKPEDVLGNLLAKLREGTEEMDM
jgi:hypothetical protein